MLTVELIAPATASPGDRVTFRFVATNTGSATLDLHLHGREPTLEVVVARPNGDVVWNRLEGAVIPGALLLHTLAPTGKLVVTADWRVRDLEPGEYLIRAALLAEESPIAAPERRIQIVATR